MQLQGLIPRNVDVRVDHRCLELTQMDIQLNEIGGDERFHDSVTDVIQSEDIASHGVHIAAGCVD